MSSLVAARAVLLAALPGVPVAPVLPNPLPRKVIRLTRVGGDRTRELDRPRILVECFASTIEGAPDVAGAERLALDGYDALRLSSSIGPWAGRYVTCWEGNSVADYPDPALQRHARWQFTGTLYLLNN